jgi:hypothetical protein
VDHQTEKPEDVIEATKEDEALKGISIVPKTGNSGEGHEGR